MGPVQPIFYPSKATKGCKRSFPVFVPALLFLCILFHDCVSSYGREQETDLFDMTIEELMEVRIKPVTGASKYEQKTTEAPASVSIITADDIRKYGYRTFAEILQSVRGLYANYDRNYHYAGVRGFGRPGDYNSRILVLLDGVKLNENIYDSAPVGTDFVCDLDLIERIEIIRGPSYSMYGNNAFLMVINVITKDAEAMKGIEAAADIGSFGSYQGRLSSGSLFDNGGQMVLSGTLFNRDGQDLYYQEFDTPDQNNGVAEDGDRDRSGSLFAKYAWRDLTLETSYVNRSKQIPTAPWDIAFNDPRNKSWDERAFADLKLDHRFDDDLGLVARLTYGYYQYEGEYAYFDEDFGTTINNDHVDGQWLGANLHLTRKFDRHMLIMGADFTDNFSQFQENYDEFAVYLDDDRNSSSWGLFLQDEYSLLTNLTLVAGLRFDHFSTFGDTANPRLAVIYRPLAGTSLKYLFGRAFRGPSVYELYYNDGDASQKANPDLQEETIQSHELVWEQLLGKNFTGTVSLYTYDAKDMITLETDADELLVYRNAGEVDAAGIEAELAVSFPGGVSGRLSYAYQESDYGGGDQVWTNSPRHLAKFNVSIPLFQDRLFFSLEEQYAGRTETFAGVSTGDYFLTNATLFAPNLVDNVDLSAQL
ncbi:MAG TPA: TonB-dependent receptor [Desulfobulbaceae bacterium]|nr:TonB-dependent receptor [Desulfobulbaceae bacterium]